MNCYALSPEPEETRWNLTALQFSGPTETASGDDGQWDRGQILDSGHVVLSGNGITIGFLIKEGATQSENCSVDVELFQIVNNGALTSMPALYLTPTQGDNPSLVVDYLSDDAISGQLRLSVISKSNVVDLTIDFDAVRNECSPTGDKPGAPSYRIIVAGDTLNGVTTRWGRSIGLVVLGEEPGANSEPAWGLNMFVREPARRVAGSDRCILSVSRAELTWASRRDSIPEVVNWVFPGEDGGSTIANSLLDVFYLEDSYISAEGKKIPMQRRTYSPTEGFQWHETVDVEIKFDAKEH